jgi:16S rRNA (uracil1498-N3)-methyltransferase
VRQCHPSASVTGKPLIAAGSGFIAVMPDYDFRSPRLYVGVPLKEGAEIALERAQAHYLVTVMRLKAGDGVLVFNGRDGEWRARLAGDRRSSVLRVDEQTRAQTVAGDLHYLFAPLKSARLDYMVQKAVELGVTRLQPVLTRHAQVTRVNAERMRSNAIEAAEQCGVLALPEIAPPVTLTQFIAERDPARILIFCDEAAETANPAAALVAVPAGSPLAVLIGPEGGFAEDERAALLQSPNVVRLALGPRILRADTAAVAALAVVQTVLGDWKEG